MANKNKNKDTKALTKQPKRHVRASIKRAFAALGLIGLGIFGIDQYKDSTTINIEKIEELANDKEHSKNSILSKDEIKDLSKICEKINNIDMKDEETVREKCTAAYELFREAIINKIDYELNNLPPETKCKILEEITDEKDINVEEGVERFTKITEREKEIYAQIHREGNKVAIDTIDGTRLVEGDDKELYNLLVNLDNLKNYGESYFQDGLIDRIDSKKIISDSTERILEFIGKYNLKINSKGEITTIENKKENEREIFLGKMVGDKGERYNLVLDLGNPNTNEKIGNPNTNEKKGIDEGR